MSFKNLTKEVKELSIENYKILLKNKIQINKNSLELEELKWFYYLK